MRELPSLSTICRTVIIDEVVENFLGRRSMRRQSSLPENFHIKIEDKQFKQVQLPYIDLSL